MEPEWETMTIWTKIDMKFPIFKNKLNTKI
jgi:hypothetical protein